MFRATRLKPGIEPLEPRTLLAVDLLANVTFTANALRAPRDLTPYDGGLVFRMNNGIRGDETWKTDGTPEGTEMMVDAWLGAGSSGPRDFHVYNGDLYFAANDGFLGYELWRSSGSMAGSGIVLDIWKGPENGIPSDFVQLNGELFFFANDGQRGRELWVSDGTAEGTRQLADSVPGGGGTSGERLTRAGDLLYFVGNQRDDNNQFALWVSDGTEAGTQPVLSNTSTADSIENMTAFGDQLVFTAQGQLWASDGTSENTHPIDGVDQVIQLRVDGEKLYVARSSDIVELDTAFDVTRTISVTADGIEVSHGNVYHWNSHGLYVSHGNAPPMILLGFNSFFGTELKHALPTALGLTFFASGLAPNTYDIWVTDGTLAGSKKLETVSDTNPEPLHGFQQLDNGIYFVATGGNEKSSLWKVEAPIPARIPGDVNGDNLVNAKDIDAVFAAARAGRTELEFDLDGDGRVSIEDGNYLITEILGTRAGDIDLNGQIDFADFLVLSANFGRQDAGWADADLNGDGQVGFPDFLLLSANFGFKRLAAL